MDPLSLYITLIIIGLFMLAIEVIVPGGIVGGIGFLALLGACLMGFSAFSPKTGIISSIAIMLGSGIIIALWIKYLPNTAVGRAITLNENPTTNTPLQHQELLQKTGTAETHLRPSGIARIDGKRIDVIADQDWIDNGAPIKVHNIQGNRIIVRAI